MKLLECKSIHTIPTVYFLSALFLTCHNIVVLTDKATQAGRRNKEIASLTPMCSTSTPGEESLTNIRATAMSRKRKKYSDKNQTLLVSVGSKKSHFTSDTLTRARAENIIKSRIESIVARYEPLDAVFCPFNISSMIVSNPCIGQYIPRNASSVMKDYVRPIDDDTKRQLIDCMRKQPGLLSVSFDGVTANGKSKTLFTVTRGCVSMFYTWINMGSDVHVSDAEVAETYTICKQVKSLFSGLGITALPMDNAAAAVATKVAKKLKDDGDHPFPLRDPVHCVDLGSKDLVKVPCLKSPLEKAIAVNKFVMGNRIANIHKEMVESGKLTSSSAGKSLPDTRMNLTNQVIESALAQRMFIMLLPQEPSFIKYKGSRDKASREKIDAFLMMCTHQFWEELSVVLRLTKHFRDVHHLLSKETTPLSCYPLVVKALWNSISETVGGEDFDRLLGDGNKDDVKNMLEVRFNLHGGAVVGRKVGLLDHFHNWCYMVDPYNWEWRNTFKFEGEGGLRKNAKEMIAHFVTGSDTKSEKTRADLLKEFEVCLYNSVIYFRCLHFSMLN